jgi:hypothetical protein
MGRLLPSLLLLLLLRCMLSAQEFRCDEYGYSYCYLKYLTNDAGEKVYTDAGNPILTTFSSNYPNNKSTLIRLPTNHIPLRICFNSTMTADALLNQNMKKAMCGGMFMSDAQFAAHVTQSIESAVYTVIQQMTGVCPFNIVEYLTNCDQLNDETVYIRFRRFGREAAGRAIGGVRDQSGHFYPRMIDLNYDDEYIVNGQQAPKQRHCFSSACTSCRVEDITGAHCLDIRRIILHELGHHLGLAHIERCMSSSTYPGSEQDYEREVMYYNINCNNYNYYQMSCYMECALKKIYCPETAGIASAGVYSTSCPLISTIRTDLLGISNVEFELYPTVISDDAIFRIRGNDEPVDMKLVDGTGRVVIHFPVLPVGSRYGRLNFSSIASGFYFLLVLHQGKMASVPIVVKR